MEFKRKLKESVSSKKTNQRSSKIFKLLKLLELKQKLLKRKIKIEIWKLIEIEKEKKI